MHRKTINHALLLAALVLTCACNKDEEESFMSLDYGFTDYSAAKITGEVVTAQAEVELNQVYDVTPITIDKSLVTKQLGVKKVPSDLVFAGVRSNGSLLCGPRYYTSAGGFYFDSKGYACQPSDPDAKLFVDATNNFTLSIGIIPDATEQGQEYVIHAAYATANAACALDITVTVTGKSAWADYTVSEDGLTYYIKEKIKTDYTPLSVFINEKSVCDALGINSFAQLISGLNNGDIVYYGVNADGTDWTNGNTANGKGCWYDKSGNVCSWKADNWFCYAEWDGSSNPVFFNVGQATAGVEVGDSATVRCRFIKGDKSVTLNFQVTIVDKL